MTTVNQTRSALFCLILATGCPKAGGDAPSATERPAPKALTGPAQAELGAKAKAAAAAVAKMPPTSKSRTVIPAPADVAAPPADATRTASGLASKVLTAGTGSEHPKAKGRVEVHYTGWTTDGRMFDSSVARGKTAKFSVNRVIKGWTEGLQLMVKGEKRRLWIPVELAYNNRPGKPAGMLVFDVELRDILAGPQGPKGPKAIPAPADVAAPPKDAQKDPSGLASKVLKAGTGKEHPKATNVVEVHYTGWTTDGKMFDSSVARGAPAKFPLNRVIKGWTVGLQLMVVGEKRRFWIPVGMAYQGRPGSPAGMLVFDVELLSIKG
jgi:FKBP-type peptidyl-prolyl cis-trans isomerase